MEGAVERLEIWTAGLLLLVAILVGTAGTLAWVAETPRAAEQSGTEALHSVAGVTAMAGALLEQLGENGRYAGLLARAASNGLPGGPFGALGALLAGVLGVPLLTATTAGVRRVRARSKRGRSPFPATMARLCSRLWQPGPALATARPRAAAGTKDRATAVAPRSARVKAEPRQSTTPALQAQPRSDRPGVWPVSRRRLARAPASIAAAEQAEGRPLDGHLPSAEAAGAPEVVHGRYAEDIACLAMRRAAALLADCGASGTVLAADVRHDDAQVLLDLRPGDQARLDAAFAAPTIETAGVTWRWRPPLLHAQVQGSAAAAPKPAPIVPLLDVGRRRLRHVSLAGWRHLGIYGDGAHAAAHHLIATLLCQQRPDELALSILDRQGWASLYRNTPHWVEPPGDGPATGEALARALRHGTAAGSRPLLLAVVEPDGATMSAFGVLLSRLSLHQSAPVYILLVQRRLQPLGRQLYLTLPALVTAGSAALELLPAVRHWPRAGSAAVLVRGRRWTGRALACDETAVGELTRRLATYPRSTVPVLWHPTTITSGA